MKYVLISLFLFSFSLYSQITYKDYNNTLVMQRAAFYQKDTFKPYSGIIKAVDSTLTNIAKIENGNDVYSETYYTKSGKMLYKTTLKELDGETYDTINKDPLLLKLPNVSMESVSFRPMNLYYTKSSDTAAPTKLTGILETENMRTFYENGIMTKIEKYYDAKFKTLKETILITHTDLGNFATEEESQEIKHEFVRYNKDGSVEKNGVYRNFEYLDK
jgi:hypothetical protein